jgi:integrase
VVPAWSPTHPRSARIVKAKVNARILPAFGDLPLNQIDTDHIGRWTHTLVADIFTNPPWPPTHQPLSTGSFAGVGHRALQTAGLHKARPDHGGLRIGDLRHTHAIWLLAEHLPVATIAKRLGHAHPLVTIRMYQHVASLVEGGHLTLQRLGLVPSPSE